jgi:hypothetical protein
MIESRHYLPFADPMHAPEWAPEERPGWLSRPADFPAFAAFCLRQLDELDRRAAGAAAQASASNPIMDALWSSSEDENRQFRRQLPRFLDEIGMDREEYQTRKRREMERLATEQDRRGPTKADPDKRQHLPAALAAQDMAKLRFVIFPRFWGRKNLASPWLGMIAAQRRGCEPSAAESWYENNRVRKQWGGGRD